MKRRLPQFFALNLFFLSLLTACAADAVSTASIPPAASQLIPFPQVQPATLMASAAFTPTPYLDRVDIMLDDVKYLPLLETALPLNSDERSLLEGNGFVVSDRVSWERFIEAYAWIYWKDLPVLVTTDSMLHAFHQSYLNMLKDLERTTLKPQMKAMLEETHSTLVEQQQANTNAELDPLYKDVDIYLSVALHLLEEKEATDEDVQKYVALATNADSHANITLFTSISEPAHGIDFTLFAPRGHYSDESLGLRGYFRAMSWLGQVDFRWLAYHPTTNEPILDQQSIVAAAILRDAIDETDQRLRWGTVNRILELLIGRSDNTTLPDFDKFLADANLSDPGQVLDADAETLLGLLLANDYGQQRITGQLLGRDFENTSEDPIPRPTSFLLLGQRFALDSFIFSELVYDRLMVEEAPKRALPSPLDALAALGSSRAHTLIEDELTKYQYASHLDALSQTINTLPDEFWRVPIYNQWLGLIRTLNAPGIDDTYPQAMRTAAWADKMLQTQLGSWVQLRHDNILYVKQSFTPGPVVCEYPAGYVEPYPAFYAALAQLAQDVQLVLEDITPSESESRVRSRILTYLNNLEIVSNQLRTLAEKELRLEAFTEQEEFFLKSMIKLDANYGGEGCGGPIFEQDWDGWYAHLFYQRDDNPALIADVHTNSTQEPSSELYPPRVLHAATGPAAAEFLIVDTDDGMTISRSRNQQNTYICFSGMAAVKRTTSRKGKTD